MLFYASERYPKEDEYSKFIRQVTGSFQAVSGPIWRWPLPEGVESPFFSASALTTWHPFSPTCSPLPLRLLSIRCSDNGGTTNAWTASENTNYQFSVNQDHLEEALDRFSQVRSRGGAGRRRLWTASHRSGAGVVQGG